jgi:hypothetical protein
MGIQEICYLTQWHVSFFPFLRGTELQVVIDLNAFYILEVFNLF